MRKFDLEEVEQAYLAYPDGLRDKLMMLRELVYDVALEFDLGAMTETLKWGQPSYEVGRGSPLRLGIKDESYLMYFNCQTSLIETFKELYKDEFRFEGNRAIVFELKSKWPNRRIMALKHCISLALCYHKLKHLPLLGV